LLRLTRALVVAVAGLAALAGSVGAQRLTGLARADSLLSAGRLSAAESIYYRLARQRPRDPSARASLGAYLGARGAWKVGVVLLEEARFFGGDARAIALELVPLYVTLGDYRSLSGLPASPLTDTERRRAEWLSRNPPVIAIADSVSVHLSRGADGTLGRLPLVLGKDTLQASIDPSTSGIVLDTSWARNAVSQLFGTGRDRGAHGVLRDVGMGSGALKNFPVRYSPMGTREAKVGLDVMARMSPTFDETQGRLVLRAPRVRPAPEGDVLRTYRTLSTLMVALGDTLVSITSPEARSLLQGRRWTWDAWDGRVVIERARAKIEK
jgi:hypothetical protein